MFDLAWDHVNNNFLDRNWQRAVAAYQEALGRGVDQPIVFVVDTGLGKLDEIAARLEGNSWIDDLASGDKPPRTATTVIAVSAEDAETIRDDFGVGKYLKSTTKAPAGHFTIVLLENFGGDLKTRIFPKIIPKSD